MFLNFEFFRSFWNHFEFNFVSILVPYFSAKIVTLADCDPTFVKHWKSVIFRRENCYLISLWFNVCYYTLKISEFKRIRMLMLHFGGFFVEWKREVKRCSRFPGVHGRILDMSFGYPKSLMLLHQQQQQSTTAWAVEVLIFKGRHLRSTLMQLCKITESYQIPCDDTRHRHFHLKNYS